MYRKKGEPAYRFETFRRAAADGSKKIYVRFIAEDGSVLATRATGCVDVGAASAEILRLASEIDLPEIEQARSKKLEATAAIDGRLTGMSIVAFLGWYWSDEGYYVKDRREAKKPLSSEYLRTIRERLKDYVAPWENFASTPLRKANFALVDRYFRDAKKMKMVSDSEKVLSPPILSAVREIIRGPFNWAAARGLCEKIDFKGLVLPSPEDRERGLLTDTEVSKILALPIQPLWREITGKERLRADVKPRPRLKGGDMHAPDNRVDIRMKAFVLLGPFCGFRRGEERGLK